MKSCVFFTHLSSKNIEYSTSNKPATQAVITQTMEPSVRKCQQHTSRQTNIHYDNTT